MFHWFKICSHVSCFYLWKGLRIGQFRHDWWKFNISSPIQLLDRHLKIKVLFQSFFKTVHNHYIWHVDSKKFYSLRSVHLYGTLQDWRTICVSKAMKIRFLLFVHFSMFISWYVHPDERDLGFNAKFLLRLWKISQFCQKKIRKLQVMQFLILFYF